MEKKKYTPTKEVEEARKELEGHQAGKPGKYVSGWQASADALLDQIEKRGPFHYDAAKDPLYRQAVDRGVALGRTAMMDTMGKAASLTGGYGNSYAQGVGQQTYGAYLQALADRLPRFQEMALKKWQAGGKDLLDRYQALSQREKDAYGRYQQALQQYFSREDRLRDVYDRLNDRDYHRYENDRDYDYALDRDRIQDALRAEAERKEQLRWEQDREYQALQDKIRQEQWEREFAEDQRRYEQEWAAKHSPSGGGGGRRHVNFKKYQDQHSMTEKEYEKDQKKAQENGHDNSWKSGSAWNPREKPYRRPNYREHLH